MPLFSLLRWYSTYQLHILWLFLVNFAKFMPYLDGNPDARFSRDGVNISLVKQLVQCSWLPRVREKSGKLKFFQGQGIVRGFCKLSGKLGNIVKCQGIVREF